MFIDKAFHLFSLRCLLINDEVRLNVSMVVFWHSQQLVKIGERNLMVAGFRKKKKKSDFKPKTGQINLLNPTTDKIFGSIFHYEVLHTVMAFG